ncbi:hypothetical protein [Halobellus litoreus]|uniref:Uncharacterized protein n=1 Tax=Halobellus litoreus TaxID=755310 RepID=A0ABD6E2K3_9EURY|nr:hypothetical protein [Halobellus litoreus]
MMSQGLFTGMIVLFWVAEALFGALVVYWFLTQGFDSDRDTADTGPVELEDSAETLRSLGLWAAFFGVIILGIVVGA